MKQVFSAVSTIINYFIVTNRSEISYRDFVTAPQEFNPSFFFLLKTLPINVMQVVNPKAFYRAKCMETFEAGLSLTVLYSDNLVIDELKPLLERRVNVFLIDDIPEYGTIMVSLRDVENAYYTCVENKGDNIIDSTTLQFFDDANSFIELLKKDLFHIFPETRTLIEEMLTNSFTDDEVSKIPYFRGAHTNFYTACQITGNFWQHKDGIDDYSEEFLNEKRKELLSNNVKGIDKDSRLTFFLPQWEQLDVFYQTSHYPIAVTDIDPEYPPLIMAVPFQNPQAEKLSNLYGVENPDIINRYLYAEQDKNYIFSFQAEEVNQEIIDRKSSALGMFVYPRLRYLDLILYLHSSFYFSPSIRFPLLGKSLTKELSFLRPNAKNRLHGNRLNKTIEKFGKKLKELILNDRLEKYLMQRNRQVVVISDLPVEWMELGRFPLAFTHDICRIAETNLKSSAIHYSRHSKIRYHISPDIIDKTLVIFGVPENEEYYEKVTSLAVEECKRLRIKYKECHSVKDFVDAVRESKPELLVIDCHGEYDDATLSSHLLINNERLIHSEIVQMGVPVPIVFLSACVTSPNYGYVHPIANAFFEAGTFTITSTYLPIDIFNGTVTYLRMLMHLDKVAKNGDFHNWLSYISYIVRSSIFTDVLKKVVDKIEQLPHHKRHDLDGIFKQIDRIKDLTATFEQRRETFQKMTELLNNMSENIRIDFKNVVYECLLYTHLGRADLIRFESWENRKRQKLNYVREIAEGLSRS